MITDSSTVVLATGRWEFISSLSSACFEVRNFGVMTVLGQLPLQSAWFDVAPDGRPTQVHATLDMTGVDTGNRRRDEDLVSPHLLDAAQYPTLTFDGGPAHRVDDTQWDLPGRLTAHGTSVDLVLRARTTSVAADCIGLSATTELDRRTLGVTAPRFLIGTRIVVHLHVAFAVPAAGRAAY